MGADVIATTRAALMRPGATTNGLGDEVDALSVVTTPTDDAELGRDLGNFPASIIERSRREFDEASNQWRTVRYYAGRVPSYVPARAGDVLLALADGKMYTIDEEEGMARGLAGRSSVTLTMKRTAP